MQSPTVIELDNHKQVAAYVVALDGMLTEAGEDSKDYIEGAGDMGDGKWAVYLKKPIPVDWYIGIRNVVKRMIPDGDIEGLSTK